MKLAAMLLAAMLALPAPAMVTAATETRPKTTVEAIEHEVMCPICGTLLELAESPQAQRERVFVAGLVAAGKSKAEIKDALVAQYGKEVLALPKASGFDLSAYLVPIVAIAVAIAALAFSLMRWRRGGDRGLDGPEAPHRPAGEDAERLEADLSRYDL